MAQVYVSGSNGAQVEIITDAETGKAEAICYGCNWADTDRGNFEDTCQLAEVHVDNNCPARVARAGSEAQ